MLLASDVAARGLDIKGVDHVVHYQVPFTVQVSLCFTTLAVAVSYEKIWITAFKVKVTVKDYNVSVCSDDIF